MADMNMGGSGNLPNRPQPRPRGESGNAGRADSTGKDASRGQQDGQSGNASPPEQPASKQSPRDTSSGGTPRSGQPERGQGAKPERTPERSQGNPGGVPKSDRPGASRGSSGQQGPTNARPSSDGPKRPDSARAGQSAGNKNTDGATGPANTNAGNPSAQGNASGPADAAKQGLNPKNMSSNATGVDYGDKGLKDRLEHQAADVAMDATPGLAQFNQARRQVKDANKAQRQAGIDNKATEKAEDVMDKGVDSGIKGAKVAAGTAAGGLAAGGAASVALAMKMMMMMKAFIVGLGTKTLGLLGSILGGIGNFVSGVLGVGAAAGKIIAGGIMSIVLTGATMAGGALMDVISPKDVGSMCIPKTKKVDNASQEYVAVPGEARVAQEESAKKLWSVYSRLGGTKAQTAAVLGNLHHESRGLDPTATETVMTEDFQMGPLKRKAMELDYDIKKFDPAYAAKYGAIGRMGIGLAQWTNGRNQLLLDFAKKTNVNWYEFDTQVRFMLAGDDPMRQEQLKNFLTTEGIGGNVSTETERFMNTWIGLSTPNASLGDRQSLATDYIFILERADADNSYADSILSGLNVDRSQGNTAQDAYFKDDGCGNAIATHYANAAADGTGEVPAGIELVPWTRETLPEGLRKFMKDPQNAGLSWGSGGGWAPSVIPNQCVAFSSSYFMLVYPDWDKDGRPKSRPMGNGIVTASGWASHYGESTSKTPSGGAVFSLAAPSPTGHTGFVQHVFANGDIFVAEQNIPGISGELAGMSYSWGFRVIPKAVYEAENFEFFKPKDATPNWGTTGKA